MRGRARSRRWRRLREKEEDGDERKEFEIFSCRPETTTWTIEPFIYSAGFEKTLHRDVKWIVYIADCSRPISRVIVWNVIYAMVLLWRCAILRRLWIPCLSKMPTCIAYDSLMKGIEEGHEKIENALISSSSISWIEFNIKVPHCPIKHTSYVYLNNYSSSIYCLSLIRLIEMNRIIDRKYLHLLYVSRHYRVSRVSKKYSLA